MMAIFGVAAVEFVNDLKRVSVECGEVVEKRNDCPMESGDARETCYDGLLDRRGHDHHQVHMNHPHGEVVEIFFSCKSQHCMSLDMMGIRTAANANHVAVLHDPHDQSLYPYLYPCGRRHGIVLHVRVRGLDGRVALGGRCDRDVQGDQIAVQYARCGGMNRSCRSDLGPRDDVARQLLWIATQDVSHVIRC
jgi:hypothetical protein